MVLNVHTRIKKLRLGALKSKRFSMKFPMPAEVLALILGYISIEEKIPDICRRISLNRIASQSFKQELLNFVPSIKPIKVFLKFKIIEFKCTSCNRVAILCRVVFVFSTSVRIYYSCCKF